MSNKPKQYLNGYTEFYKLKFKVTEDVLIPRPETELLVDEVLNFLRANNYELLASRSGPTILDIGTGSGNISVSIAKNLPENRHYLPSHIGSGNAKIIAADISSNTLNIAKQNAKLHRVQDRINFIESNLLSDFSYTLYPKPKTLIIVTNLPYIPSSRVPYLDSSVKDFEPHLALDGGSDGFDLYRKLFKQMKELDWKPDLFVGEIDYTQSEIAYMEAKKYFPEYEVEVKLDLAKNPRVLVIKAN